MASATLLDVAKRRVLVCDGAMGSTIQALDLPLADFNGLENCTEVLVLTRPDVICDVHRSYLAVGCDAVLTNTLGANKVVLSEFELAKRTYEINRRAAEVARDACHEFASPARPRFVMGSIGPGTRLPSLGQIGWDDLVDSYETQSKGLLDGGVDALIVETCQDILQAKSAIVAATDAMQNSGKHVPIICTITIEPTGTMLIGTDVAAATVALEAYPQVVAIGLNCGTGPTEMGEHVRYLSANCSRHLVVQPNAGLPHLVEGKPHYSLSAEAFATELRDFVEADGVSIVGGCCGTTPAHIAALVDAVENLQPIKRHPVCQPSVSSLYQAVTIHQEPDCLAIGERTNANGSKKFRELLAAEDFDGMVQLARAQVASGSHLLDVCTAFVGRDEAKDMAELIKRLAVDATAPLVIDSTEAPVLEAALKLAGGKCIINSINLEQGEEKVDEICQLAKRYGAALIALTIDEEGMAKTSQRKVQIAQRLYQLVTNRHGIRAQDLIFDPLTFTICTGSDNDRPLAAETLDALARIKSLCTGVHTLLGISNVSFGVKPPVRRIVNSVFLHHAREKGLDAAILHAEGILPLYKIDEGHRRLAEDLIFDRRPGSYDPLQRLLEAFEGAPTDGPTETEELPPVEQRLKQRIINGDRRDLGEDLDEATLTHPPLEIINDILLDGMKTIGDLFGAGQMQLPFVLKSAETMKAAVAHLQAHIEKADSNARGTIVLATVRGDVHDIGKNLVDIILTNNGYTVHNLGTKQPISAIIDAYEESGADAIGMSGLLVRSTLVMRENLLALNDHGIEVPVILGGAALTRKYVDNDLQSAYKGRVFYAKDAFAGLHLMEELTGRRAPVRESTLQRTLDSGVSADDTPVRHIEPDLRPVTSRETPSPPDFIPPQSDISRDEPVPTPPFWGPRVIERIELDTPLEYLNENALFQMQWRYHKSRRMPDDYERFIRENVRPTLRKLLQRCEEEDILQLQAIYGYWPAQADGDTLIVVDPEDRERELARFDFPRMGKPPYRCISDFFRPITSGVYDVAAFTIVTAGRRVGEIAHELFSAGRYQDYLHLHGLGVEMAEALAEYIHKHVRTELGIAAADTPDARGLFQQRYQGSRYSFGYPACPRLEDQVKLWPLLEPERIGVVLTEEFQLDPEQTTTAIIAHHRQAKYFNAG